MIISVCVFFFRWPFHFPACYFGDCRRSTLDVANTLLKKAMAQYEADPSLYLVHFLFCATSILASPGLNQNLFI